MTQITTDNPLVQWWVWCLDITWQYWYIFLAVGIVAIWLIARHFAKRQREWDEHMLNEQRKFDEFKEKVKKYQQPTPEDLYEKDVVELQDVHRITGDQIIQATNNYLRRTGRGQILKTWK